MNKKLNHFALLRIGNDPIGGEFIVPTEIASLKVWEIDKPIPYNSFIFGSKVEEYKRFHEIEEKKSEPKRQFRYFKNDLSLSASELNITLKKASPSADSEKRNEIKKENDQKRNDLKWSMQSLRAQNDNAFVYTKASTSRSTIPFNPIDATEIFIANVLKSALSKIESLIPNAEHINVHVTIPAFDDRKLSENYRNNLMLVIEEIQKRGVANEVSFNIKGLRDFLYEPYGVFYYYSAVEGLVDMETAKGTTYMVFDMGGSTTDLAIIQVNKGGKHSKVYPIATSIKCAGSNFDEYILGQFINKNETIKDLNSEQIDEALRDIEAAKIKLCETQEPNEEIDIKIKNIIIRLNRKNLGKWVSKWWDEEKNMIRNGLIDFIDRAQKLSKSNPQFLPFSKFDKIFLAGGSVELIGIMEKLEIQLQDYLDDRSVTDVFVRPKNAPANAVTAFGLAYEIALRSQHRTKIDSTNSIVPLMERAEKVYCKITTENGTPLSFKHRNINSDSKNDLLIYDSEKKYTDTTFSKDNYNSIRKSPNDLTDNLLLHFRTDLETEDAAFLNQEKLTVPLDPKKTHNLPNEQSWEIGFSHTAPKLKLNKQEELEIKFKPFFFRNGEHGLNSIPERIDLREKGVAKIKFTPPPLLNDINTVHLCIDFGMSNTCIAIYSPDISLPNHSDFKFIDFITDTRINLKNESNVPKLHNKNSIANETIKTNIKSNTVASDEEILTKTFTTEEHKLNESPIESTSNATDKSYRVFESILDKLSQIEKAISSNETSNKINHQNELIKGIFSQLNKQTNIETASKNINHRSIAKNKAINWGINQKATDYNIGKYSYDVFKLFIKSKNYVYSERVLRSAWSQAMNQNGSLMILAGPPGTGKTSLVRLLSDFFSTDDRTYIDNGFFHKVIPVLPTWFSPTSLLGSYSEIDGKFHSTPFLEFCLLSEEFYKQSGEGISYSKKFFLCLDEFNLAHPEQYLANVLSAMEFDYGYEGSFITVCEKSLLGLDTDLKITIPPNLKIFATINTDSTSKLLSPKVLDRAVYLQIVPDFESIINFAIKKGKELEELDSRFSSLYESFISESDTEKGILFELFNLAKTAQVPLGFRGLERMKSHVAQHPVISTKMLDGKELTPDDIKELLGEVVCSIFLSKFPGAYNVQGPRYSKVLDELLNDSSASNLITLPGVKPIINRLREGYAGQSAF
jgi:MoxR-like ATPase